MAQVETDNASAKALKKRKKRKSKQEKRAEKVALVVALEVRRLIEDVAFRKGLLVDVWSRMRARAPLLKVLHSRYDDISASDLVLLSEAAILSLDKFYRQVDEFRIYVETTEDMPHALENQYTVYAGQMEQLGLVALADLMKIHGKNLNGSDGAIQGGMLLEF